MPKTYNDIYFVVRNKLRESGVEAYGLEARTLLAAAAGGQVGSFMGFTWIEVNGFASSTDIAYYPHGGTKASVTAANLAKVEFIMYDPNAFGVGDNFSIVRMVDSELFAGSKAQVEENAALRVLDAAQVHVKSYASA